ncbi:precorrin-3B synthase [Sphingomonas sp. PvP055]|uniref:cobalamin biosynthesis protein CobG n=1 Tax=Sphingomonas sp. PvP055 TaxID=3156391 RepID=UPI003397CBE0
MSVIRGWCPTAHRPMEAGDGLIVRVRPRLARVTRTQVLGLCAAAASYGNGHIDLTNRANLQIRGVPESQWPALIERLCALELVDPDPALEARHAVLVAPDWRAGDDTHRIATELAARLAEFPDLPGKFGFAIDTDAAPVLQDDPADIRLERDVTGGVILRADGRARGVSIPVDDAVSALLALAEWFVASGGRAAGRIARHAAALPAWADQDALPAPAGPPLGDTGSTLGPVHGVAFGRIEADALAALMTPSATGLRVTPWRRLIVEGGAPSPRSEPPGLDVDACVGAPSCPQATVETRTLACRLAPHVEGRLHVSGCAKGCARARPADVVLTGRDSLFDVAFDARADAVPELVGLDAAHILAHFGAS